VYFNGGLWYNGNMKDFFKLIGFIILVIIGFSLPPLGIGIFIVAMVWIGLAESAETPQHKEHF